MPFCICRETPLHDWVAYAYIVCCPPGGEIIELDVQWWSQATAERDRRNGKGGEEQGRLPL